MKRKTSHLRIITSWKGCSKFSGLFEHQMIENQVVFVLHFFDFSVWYQLRGSQHGSIGRRLASFWLKQQQSVAWLHAKMQKSVEK